MAEKPYQNLQIEFAEFKRYIANCILSGMLRVSKPLSDLDMATTFAVGLMYREGYRYVDPSEIYEKILTFTDEGIFDRNDGWYSQGLANVGLEVTK